MTSELDDRENDGRGGGGSDLWKRKKKLPVLNITGVNSKTGVSGRKTH